MNRKQHGELYGICPVRSPASLHRLCAVGCRQEIQCISAPTAREHTSQSPHRPPADTPRLGLDTRRRRAKAPEVTWRGKIGKGGWGGSSVCHFVPPIRGIGAPCWWVHAEESLH